MTEGVTAVTTSASHDIIDTAAPAAVATVTGLSADTGTVGDFITSVASQTVSSSYTGALLVGEKIQVSTDGNIWIDATAALGVWSASGVTLAAGTGTLSVRTIDAANNTTAGTGHSYTLDQTAPVAAVASPRLPLIPARPGTSSRATHAGCLRHQRSAWRQREGADQQRRQQLVRCHADDGHDLELRRRRQSASVKRHLPGPGDRRGGQCWQHR